MAYGSSPESRLKPYPKLNLNKNQLSLGFWSGQRSPSPHGDVQWLKENGYAGIMIFGFEEQLNVDLMGELVNVWYGSGNWNPPQ
ncbi:hypothetical protein [Dendronalium sp. ChiSLP03b]|uniref:hypothetical protein n=1 Tax=Dendronalium sp. ChiSLP03b TaxID=3075381 RepID=UPI002AD59011|nr:hypothetical protein [Dendronalium sp. ChiSLP03b]MDZ8208817.1 hypothetical protein [Dendronalium sp. ChiSLP03b]